MRRRTFLELSAAAAGSLAFPRRTFAAPRAAATDFLIACMTLPYSRFPLARALSGIQAAGFNYVAWGTTHREDGADVPVMAKDASPAKAKELAERCRGLGLSPVMMFSEIYPEALDAVAVLTRRIQQAAAAGIPQVLTFGHPEANRTLWVKRFQELGPIARDHGVLIVVKQHGETGQVTGEIVREVNDVGVRVNYDAGNVMDYTKGQVDPLEDIKSCQDLIRSLCIKDHRMFPKSEDCGPGLGEIDHYRLLSNLTETGLALPLCCENISAPGLRATTPEEVDALARRAREFLELVTRGLQAHDEAAAND